ncbi:MAG TPA: ABC transporter substrate-binding protein [Spirochaetia bacterium]|nr:MAG: ABC transporter substrate-binding protein [Spirochaetes bacterium GWB1_36_13]HCL55935.1 ABC transporter substrate-binding protein [Spirochaetia bacterium]
MMNLLKIGLRNLRRQKRRSLLTLSLITLGVLSVLLFIGIAGSFKNMMIGQITDSSIGHLQIHKKGYVESIDNNPLDLNFTLEELKMIEEKILQIPQIESFTKRIRFGGMLSNFNATSSIRINGIDPLLELKTMPLLKSKIKEEAVLIPGEIWIPEITAKGLDLKEGDTVVLIANNKDGSVNGKQFLISSLVSNLGGTGSRDAYIHFEDAMELLRIEKTQMSEFSLRLTDFKHLASIEKQLKNLLKSLPGNQQFLEIHTWDQLVGFGNIAKMIDLMSLFIKIIMIAIVLISIMNVMTMAVYERIREIGTISAIGATPKKILSLFLAEGFLIGILGTFSGLILGAGLIKIIKILEIPFNFGKMKGILLLPEIGGNDILSVSLIVVFVSILASFIPALKASKMEPVEALRHV